MKKLTMVLLVALCVATSCQKQSVADTTSIDNTSLTAKTLDFRNPDPTWIQVTSPLLRPATWAGFTFAGFSAGIQGPYDTDGLVITPDTTVIVKFHLHVGLRYFNGQWKADVVDYRHYFINGLDVYKKMTPNGGVMGDYEFTDTVKITRNGYYSSYFTPTSGYDSTYLNYNWNGITPEIHSKATNGWLNSGFFAGIHK